MVTREEYDEIRKDDKTAYEQNDMLLDLLTSENQCVKFLTALQRTGQQHVVNYITQKGGKKTQRYRNILVCRRW